VTSIRKWVERLLAPGGNRKDELWLEVRCNRCGETIRARVDLRNDLSLLDEGEYEKAAYFCRKILIGAQRCYQPVEVELYFDMQRGLVEHRVSGGEFISRP
jgi:hypothetical protein